MTNYAFAVISCILLAAGMVACTVWGHRIGRRRYSRNAVGEELPTAVFDAAVMTLLGLMIAFTFANAYSRFEKRRDLIVQEYNAIGTANARLQLLPANWQGELHDKLREYVKERYQLWLLLPDWNATLAEYAGSTRLQEEIWDDALDASKSDATGNIRLLLLPALNNMFDYSETELIMVKAHPPLLVFVLLFFLSLVAAWTIGFGMGNCVKPSYLHAVGFAAVVAFSMFVIFEIEIPRHGFVTLNKTQELIKQLGESMK